MLTAAHDTRDVTTGAYSAHLMFDRLPCLLLDTTGLPMGLAFQPL